MARLKDLGKVADAFMIPLTLLKPGFNPRQDFSHVPDLAKSLMQEGQLSPCVVRLADDGESAILTDGESRWRAANYANTHLSGNVVALKCVSEPKNTTEDSRIFRQLAHNDTGRALQPIERAKAYKLLIEKYKCTKADIARRVGKTSQHVADMLALLDAPEEIQKGVQQGRVSATAAIKASRSSSKVKDRLVEKLKADEKENLRVQDVEIAEKGYKSMLSAKDINKLLTKARENQKAARKGSKEEARWEGVVYGIECVLGKHEM